jgi:hypothetical protein
MADLTDEPETETLEPQVIPVLRVVGQAPLEKNYKAEAAKDQENLLKELQEEIFRSSLEVGVDTMHFRDVDPQAEKPEDDPQFREWRNLYGHRKALRKWKVARAGWLPKKDAPVGITEGTSMAVGIMKARAVEKGGTRVLNVGTVNMYAEIPTLPEKEVE